MKNLYLFILLLLSCNTFSQQNLQNANWFISVNGAVTFLPDLYNPTILPGSIINSIESCASVSNQQGELLFYTNGETVWNANHQVMTNGTNLLGHKSTTQMVVIPRPKYQQRYYIITINGVTGNEGGLHYTEVNMENGLGEVVADKKNIPFKDHNGVLINASYGNVSEKVTSAKHSDGENYWMVAQVNNNIYSYEIRSTGPQQMPSSYTPSIMDLSINDNNGKGEMKISPDAQNIGICYNGEIINSGGIIFGGFNNTSGQVTLTPGLITIPDGRLYYGLEFAPTQKLAYLNISHKLYKYDIATNDLQQAYNLVPGSGLLQLAINGKIYIYYVANNTGHLGAINNPDNFDSPDFDPDAIILPSNTIWTYALPQWVHWQVQNCLSNVTLTLPDSNFPSHNYNYSDYIITTDNYSTHPYQEINMTAENYILLEPNSTIEYGTDFLAQINTCSSVPQGRPAQQTEATGNESLIKSYNGFTVYPNPTNSSVTVKFETSVGQFSIYDITGKQLINIPNNNANETQIDLSNLAAGIYLLTADRMPIQKIIKN